VADAVSASGVLAKSALSAAAWAAAACPEGSAPTMKIAAKAAIASNVRLIGTFL
jgi:hypothetical protein